MFVGLDQSHFHWAQTQECKVIQQLLSMYSVNPGIRMAMQDRERLCGVQIIDKCFDQFG